MRDYGHLVNRIIGPTKVERKARSRVRLQPMARLISDPLGDIETAADRLDNFDGTRPATAWMQRAAKRARSPVQAKRSGLKVYDGRACCFEHLIRFEGRPDMKLPLITECLECHAKYEIAMTAVSY
tara:strand:- start:4478 stop:4855 length:378 start_codon:yes stop_codon:yes gene_type:complete